MNYRGKFLTKSTLPWALIFIFGLVYLGWGLFSVDCPKEGSLYMASPDGKHVAQRYFYGCGGGTVGFTQNVDVDGHTVFSTYGGGKSNATISWKSENELHIVYIMQLSSVQTYEPQHQDISIKYFSVSENHPAVTIEQLQAARKAAGY